MGSGQTEHSSALMTAVLTFVPKAQIDLAEAYRWYEQTRPGLGLEFLHCIEIALRSIERNPLIYPVVYETYRRALVRRFPFAIFFEFKNPANACIVYAVFHCSQDPDKWRDRLPS